MLNDGCLSCVHRTYVNENPCGIGENKKYNQWWENNSHKCRNIDVFDEMDCFEETPISRAARETTILLKKLKK